MQSLLIIILLLLPKTFQLANHAEGKLLYEKRAEGCIGLKANPAPINKALEYWQSAYAKGDNKEEAGIYLMRCHTYIGRFVEPNSEAKKSRFLICRKIGDELIKAYPKSAALRFEYISVIGLWAEQVGAMKCAKDGILGTMKDQTETLIKLDTMFFNSCGFKILGVLNLRTPYIPFFLTWPSDKEGNRLIEKAVKYFPKDLGNNFYFAESLIKLGKKDRAKIYLNAVLGLPCRKELYLEDRTFQEDAKAILAKIK